MQPENVKGTSPSATQGLEDWLGRTAARQVRVTADMIDSFVRLSGDASPIHVDDEAARQRGLAGRVAHGALLGALVSQVIGMDLPGAEGILQELNLRFHNPCYANDVLTVTITVAEVFSSVSVLRLKVRIVKADGALVASGSAQSGIART